jgi:hypothetical protein
VAAVSTTKRAARREAQLITQRCGAMLPRLPLVWLIHLKFRKLFSVITPVNGN